MKPLIASLLALAGTVHASGTLFSTVLSGIGQEYANAVTSDAQGNTYVAGRTYSKDFPVTPGSYQPTFANTSDAFVVKLGPDGKVLWGTFLGGILDESINGIALDPSGNVWVAGWTNSPDFPTVNPVVVHYTYSGYSAFVAKFDPTGAKLLFCSQLPGTAAVGVAVDSAGNAYVASNSGAATPGIFVLKLSPQGTVVYSYSRPDGFASAIALDASGAAYVAGSTASSLFTQALQTFTSPGAELALAFKISPDGSQKLWEKQFGGSTLAQANAIAVDSAGEAWIAGSTASADFPLAHPLQSSLGARPLFQTNNGGVTWTPVDDLPFALPRMLAVDPSNPATLYEATSDLGIFKSTNGGATWTQSNKGIASTDVQTVTVDPVHPQTLYAASAATVYKSTDGAGTWTAIDTPGYAATQISVDAQNDNILYTVSMSYKVSFRKSTDGGATWSNVSFPQSSGVAALVLDPRKSGHLIAISNELFLFNGMGGSSTFAYLYSSNDGGATWTQIQQVAQPTIFSLLADASTNPTTFYDGLSLRSTDGGVTWAPFPSVPSTTGSGPIAVDPGGTLYAAVDTGFFVSRDHGATWTSVASSDPVAFSLYAAGSAGTLYGVANELGTAGFVTKLSAEGSTLAYSTYLRAHAGGKFGPLYASEPTDFEMENWAAGIALDAAGNVVVTGGTHGSDFPTAKAAQAEQCGAWRRVRRHHLGRWQRAAQLDLFRRIAGGWCARRSRRSYRQRHTRRPDLFRRFSHAWRGDAAFHFRRRLRGEARYRRAGDRFGAQWRELPTRGRVRIVGDDQGRQSREHHAHLDRRRFQWRQSTGLARWRERDHQRQDRLPVLHQPRADQRAGAR